jgi:hypothetical protein
MRKNYETPQYIYNYPYPISSSFLCTSTIIWTRLNYASQAWRPIERSSKTEADWLSLTTLKSSPLRTSRHPHSSLFRRKTDSYVRKARIRWWRKSPLLVEFKCRNRSKETTWVRHPYDWKFCPFPSFSSLRKSWVTDRCSSASRERKGYQQCQNIAPKLGTSASF